MAVVHRGGAAQHARPAAGRDRCADRSRCDSVPGGSRTRRPVVAPLRASVAGGPASGRGAGHLGGDTRCSATPPAPARSQGGHPAGTPHARRRARAAHRCDHGRSPARGLGSPLPRQPRSAPAFRPAFRPPRCRGGIAAHRRPAAQAGGCRDRIAQSSVCGGSPRSLPAAAPQPRMERRRRCLDGA